MDFQQLPVQRATQRQKRFGTIRTEKKAVLKPKTTGLETAPFRSLKQKTGLNTGS